MEKIVIISVFTIVIHGIETLSYAVRLAGVRTNKLAISLSLFNIIVIMARTAYTFQAMLTGSLSDFARKTQQIDWIEGQFRVILGAASIGTIMGAIMIPTFVSLFSKIIIHFEITGSVPKLLKEATTIQNLRLAKQHLRMPLRQVYSRLRIGGIPKRLLLVHIFVTAIYTTGILSALYASVISPDTSTTSQMASGLINGLATVFLVIFIDPKVALLTEQVMQGTQEQKNIDKMVGVLTVSRLVGTLAAQLLLVPAGLFIAWMSKFFA